MSWTDSEQQRRPQQACPCPEEYRGGWVAALVVRADTDCWIRKVGTDRWRQFRTTREILLRIPTRLKQGWMVFRLQGWELKVWPKNVESARVEPSAIED